jgi:hypothetical protein
MAKKETIPTHTTIKTEGDNSSVHYHVGDNNSISKKEKESSWVFKLIVGGVISIAVALVVFYVENRGSHSEPIHNDPPVILPLKK